MTRFSLVVVAFCAPSAAAALLNTCWKLDLDLGQERGSWMPPTWGKSGARARATPVVEFTDDNSVRLLGSGAWDHLTVKWRTVDGSEDDKSREQRTNSKEEKRYVQPYARRVAEKWRCLGIRWCGRL